MRRTVIVSKRSDALIPASNKYALSPFHSVLCTCDTEIRLHTADSAFAFGEPGVRAMPLFAHRKSPVMFSLQMRPPLSSVAAPTPALSLPSVVKRGQTQPALSLVIGLALVHCRIPDNR